jgi:adenosine kinase
MDILLSGSIAYDYLMSFPGYFQEHILPDRLEALSLSFLVESMDRRRGGTAPNIAYTLALLGGRPRLLATVGDDFAEYRRWLESKGVNTTDVREIPGEFTASFFVNTDRANAQIASFYPGAMAYADQLSLHEVSGGTPDLVVVSPNDPAAMRRIAIECQELGIPYVYDPSQQIVRLDAAELRAGLQGALALFVNSYEFSLIQKKTAMDSKEILGHIAFMVVTDGERGAVIWSGEDEHLIPVVPPQNIADPTGVGDAFRAGFLTGYSRGWELEICGQAGSLAATYCLEQHGSQGHKFTPGEFITRFREHFEDHGRLQELLPE